MTLFRDLTYLDDIGRHHNTNKASRYTGTDGVEVTYRGLLAHYEFFIRDLASRPGLRVLELGAGYGGDIGASMRTWRDFFPAGAELHVVDNNPAALALEAEGFAVHIGDLSDRTFRMTLGAMTWDLVIDDASHLWSHQINAFRDIFPSIRPGGIYIVEDLCTSYDELREPYAEGLDQRDAVNYFLAISRAACGGSVDGDRLLRDAIYRLTDRDVVCAKSVDVAAWVSNSCIMVRQ